MGSVTKPFTAVAVLQLYELGLLDIDLPISTYVDEILMRDNGTTLLEIWNNDTIINNVRSSLRMGVGITDGRSGKHPSFVVVVPL